MSALMPGYIPGRCLGWWRVTARCSPLPVDLIRHPMWRSLYVDLRSLEFVREEHDGRAVYSAIVWGPDEMFVLNHLEGFWPESELLEIAMVVPGWWTAAAGI